jgi:tetratricopeptide (TPR) repeat protein
MKESYDEELARLTKDIELNPTDTSVYFRRAIFHDNNDKPNLAIADLDKILEINPKDSYAYFTKAGVYDLLNEYAMALYNYNKAIELEIENKEDENNSLRMYYKFRAALHDKCFNYGLAISDYTNSIKFDPNYGVDTFRYRASLISKLLEEYSSRNLEINNELKLSAIRDLVDIDEFMLSELNNASERGLDDKTISFYRGQLYLKDELALNDCNEAIKLDPNNAKLYANRAEIYMDDELAIEDYSKAIELAPSKQSYYFYRAMKYHRLSKLDLEMADYETMLKVSKPNHYKPKLDALMELLWSYTHFGLYKKLLMCCDIAYAINNERRVYNKHDVIRSNILIYYYKAIAYSKLNELQKALNVCNEMMDVIPDNDNQYYLQQYHLAIDLAIQNEDFEKAKQYNNQYFSSASYEEKKHEEIYTKHLSNSQELERKNKALEEKITELELEKQQKEEAYQKLYAKEKEMLSFFTHTMRNALASAPESLRQAIRLLGSEDYESNQKNYEAINEITALFSTLSLTDCLIDTFKQSIYEPDEFKRAWESDIAGEASPEWFIASALRQSLNRILFMSDTTELRKLLHNQPTRIKPTRKSFIEHILPLEINSEGIDTFFEWLKELPTIEVSIASTPVKFGMNNIKYSLLFAITSELILNALKYWNGQDKIYIVWEHKQSNYVFRVLNGCMKNASSNLAGTNKGLAFIKRLTHLLGEQATFDTQVSDTQFEVTLTLQASLL